MRWQCLTQFAIANHSWLRLLQLICPQLIVFQFPTLLLFFIEFVAEQRVEIVSERKIYFYLFMKLWCFFFINWRQVLSKSNFSPFSGVTLDLWLQSYGLCGHFCTSSRLLGTNFEFLPLLPFRPFLLFQKKMSTRCVGGCRLLLCKNMVTHQQHWQQGQ